MCAAKTKKPMNFNFETWGLAVSGIVGVVGHFVNGVRKKGVTWIFLISNSGIAFCLPIAADVVIVYFAPHLPFNLRLGISGVIGANAHWLMDALTKFLQRYAETVTDKVTGDDIPNHDTDGEAEPKEPK